MATESKRQRQVAEAVKRHFGEVLQQNGIYVYGAAPLVTVTSVKMSPDMSIAKIYLSVFNVEDKQTVVLEMEEEKPRLKSYLAQRLKRHLRRVPDIDFYLDDTLDEMYRLNELFGSLRENKQMGEEE